MRSCQEAICAALAEPGSVHTVQSADVYLKYDVWPVPADGQCLWTALALSFVLLQNDNDVSSLEELDAEELLRLGKSIRRSAWSELRDADGGTLKDSYAPFFAAGEEGTNLAQTSAEYLDALRAGHVFGGPLELQALTQRIRHPVLVFNILPLQGGKQEAMITAYKAEREESRTLAPLLLLRRDYHYDVLVPLAHISLTPTRAHSCDSRPWPRG